MSEKHNHYFRDCPYDKIDVYRIIDIFEITDPAAQHILKSVLQLVSGDIKTNNATGKTCGTLHNAGWI